MDGQSRRRTGGGHDGGEWMKLTCARSFNGVLTSVCHSEGEFKPRCTANQTCNWVTRPRTFCWLDPTAPFVTATLTCTVPHWYLYPPLESKVSDPYMGRPTPNTSIRHYNPRNVSSIIVKHVIKKPVQKSVPLSDRDLPLCY